MYAYDNTSFVINNPPIWGRNVIEEYRQVFTSIYNFNGVTWSFKHFTAIEVKILCRNMWLTRWWTAGGSLPGQSGYATMHSPNTENVEYYYHWFSSAKEFCIVQRSTWPRWDLWCLRERYHSRLILFQGAQGVRICEVCINIKRKIWSAIRMTQLVSSFHTSREARMTMTGYLSQV